MDRLSRGLIGLGFFAFFGLCSSAASSFVSTSGAGCHRRGGRDSGSGCCLWVMHGAMFDRRQIHLSKTKNGDSRTVPLNAVAVAALKQLHGAGEQLKATPVFPSLRTGEWLQGSRGWFQAPSSKQRSRGIRGIATAILLQVD